MMLQQTQVATVIPYYTRWMKAFPTVEHLARAREEKVLKLWEGLGYYNRARHLHRASQIIVKKHGGKIPHRMEDLIELPGIGPYSAGAILSIAYHQPKPIVDGNVMRVLSRFFGILQPINHPATQKKLWSLSALLVDSKNPSASNQGMMELGALLCLRDNPLCHECPVAEHCFAKKHSLQDRIPYKKKRLKIKKIEAVACIVQKDGRFLIHKRPKGEVMGGLWEFPEWKITRRKNPAAFLKERLGKELSVHPQKLQSLTNFKRRYTRFEERLHVFLTRLSGAVPQTHWPSRWIKAKEISKYPFSSAHAKIAKMICRLPVP